MEARLRRGWTGEYRCSRAPPNSVPPARVRQGQGRSRTQRSRASLPPCAWHRRRPRSVRTPSSWTVTSLRATVVPALRRSLVFARALAGCLGRRINIPKPSTTVLTDSDLRDLRGRHRRHPHAGPGVLRRGTCAQTDMNVVQTGDFIGGIRHRREHAPFNRDEPNELRPGVTLGNARLPRPRSWRSRPPHGTHRGGPSALGLRDLQRAQGSNSRAILAPAWEGFEAGCVARMSDFDVASRSRTE